jgi:hypothetical protein
MKEALTLYRLTLGQPRQEDMMEMMVRRGVLAESVAKLDLSPPKRSWMVSASSEDAGSVIACGTGTLDP